ncbi:hypothetical protein [Actinacidiphila oryziradicis]|uniref:hypothetical protein n=1 Tax=Actinacidiphila oryziradicis TaxID=2571141 RepID=UPI00145D0647|nr:hypothetical protein [Actinacidiphila oryziradicis]
MIFDEPTASLNVARATYNVPSASMMDRPIGWPSTNYSPDSVPLEKSWQQWTGCGWSTGTHVRVIMSLLYKTARRLLSFPWVFAEEVFRYGRGDDAGQAEAVAYGRPVGVPDYQLDRQD